MSVILKFTCPAPGCRKLINMHKESRIIRVSRGFFWADTDHWSGKEDVMFRTIATGEDFYGEVMGTWDDDIYVWHLIKEKE